MKDHINKSQIIKFLKENKLKYRLDSNEFKPIFIEYILNNKIGFYIMTNALNVAIEKKAISKRAYTKLNKIIDDDELCEKIDYSYSWNFYVFERLMKESRYDEEEILLIIKNLYRSGEINQNDVERYANETNQYVEDLKIEKIETTKKHQLVKIINDSLEDIKNTPLY